MSNNLEEELNKGGSMSKVKLALIQNRVGKFNMLGNEKSLAFLIGFTDEDGEVLKVGKGGLPVPDDYYDDTYDAIFKMPTSEDDPDNASQQFLRLFNDRNYSGLFQEHQEGHKGFITGLDYPEQRIMFAYFIKKNFIDIEQAAIDKEKKEDLKSIALLEKQLTKLKSKKYCKPNIDDSPELFGLIINGYEEELHQYIGWRDEYKETTDSWKTWDTKVTQLRKVIKDINGALEELNKEVV